MSYLIDVVIISTILLSIYIAFESLCVIAKMPGGMIYFCHKTKYALALGSSFAFAYFAVSGTEREVWLAFGSAGNIAWFVWPRTVYRLKEYIRLLDEFESGDSL